MTKLGRESEERAHYPRQGGKRKGIEDSYVYIWRKNIFKFYCTVVAKLNGLNKKITKIKTEEKNSFYRRPRVFECPYKQNFKKSLSNVHATENDRFFLFCNLFIVLYYALGTRGQATYSERTDARYRGTDPAHPGTYRVNHQICRLHMPCSCFFNRREDDWSRHGSTLSGGPCQK